jgi:hypothetical protein
MKDIYVIALATFISCALGNIINAIIFHRSWSKLIDSIVDQVIAIIVFTIIFLSFKR